MSFEIEIKNVSKTFTSSSKTGGDVLALDNVSFKVEPGDIFGFVGANGAGKSTTMRIIMGILDASSGEIYLDKQKANDSVRRRIGYMPAERGLYAKMNVIDQLVYFARLRGLSAKKSKSNADYWIEKLNLGEYSKKLTATLSTGNMQKVQLATCMVSDPECLILDEPFSGLDPIAVNSFEKILISEANQHKKTIIFSSHQLELVDQIANKVGVISSGKMIGVGSPDQLRKFAHEKYNSPLTVTIPTPLSNIFGNIVADTDK